MASWWKLIAAQQSAVGSSAGPFAKQLAFKLGAQSMNGLTWEAKLVSRNSYGRVNAYGGRGAWARRLVNPGAATVGTAYGTAGAYGRQILKQNLIGATVPTGNHAITVPVGGIGVHP